MTFKKWDSFEVRFNFIRPGYPSLRRDSIIVTFDYPPEVKDLIERDFQIAKIEVIQ